MKKLLLLTALLPSLLWAQTDDTARGIVDRYVALLNYDALPTDSMLVMETVVTYHAHPDTFVIRRWFLPPNMQRIEVWRQDSLTAGFCTNGTDRFRQYSAVDGWWNDLFPSDFERKISSYDFRNSLYRRDSMVTYTYAGLTTLKGEPLQAVRVEQPDVYTRYLLFEQRSGLLLFIIETNEMPSTSFSPGYNHAAWKAYHEYLPVGSSLIASQESFMRNGMLTIMNTTAHFEPRNTLLFNQD